MKTPSQVEQRHPEESEFKRNTSNSSQTMLCGQINRHQIFEALSPDNQLKVDLLIDIHNETDYHAKAQKIREAAATLHVNRSTVSRMLNKFEQFGVSGIVGQSRSDLGKFRISEYWQKYILDTYKNGQKYGRNYCRNQVFLLVKAHAEVELGLKPGQYPSHTTVYKILNPIVRRQKTVVRHPGQGISKVIHTTKGDIPLTHSNQVWQSDHTLLDILIQSREGSLIGRPWITTIIDSYSGCIMGFNLAFEQPSAFEVGLALRHAILPKKTIPFQNWGEAWDLFGVPEYLFTDHGKDFKSSHIQRIGNELGFESRYRTKPSDGGLVESPFGKINTEILNNLPGQTGSNVQKRPKNAEEFCIVTLSELEHVLVEYFSKHFNGHAYPKVAYQTRIERWRSMLLNPPKRLNERDLDICLLKKTTRKVEKYGVINFEQLKYQGNLPRSLDGQTVSLRYDPRNICSLLVYSCAKENEPSQFLGVVKAQDLESEELYLKEWKDIKKRLREKGEKVDNTALLKERLALKTFSDEKVEQLKQKKRRRKSQKQLSQDHNLSKVTELFPKKGNKPESRSKVDKALSGNLRKGMKGTTQQLKDLSREKRTVAKLQSLE